ncbi:MAG: hypothetical protein U0414_17725 [Polyangiaceae bacterium]
MRRWRDVHVYVQARREKYGQTVDAIARACGGAGVTLTREDLPRALELATNVTRLLTAPFVAPRNDERLQRLRGEDVQLYLYPADLLVRGKEEIVARVRTALVRSRKLGELAYLVESRKAQNIQDALAKLPALPPIGDKGLRHRYRWLHRHLDEAAIPFDEWATLEAQLRRGDLSATNGGFDTPVAPPVLAARLRPEAHSRAPRPRAAAARAARSDIDATCVRTRRRRWPRTRWATAP